MLITILLRRKVYEGRLSKKQKSYKGMRTLENGQLTNPKKMTFAILNILYRSRDVFIRSGACACMCALPTARVKLFPYRLVTDT